MLAVWERDWGQEFVKHAVRFLTQPPTYTLRVRCDLDRRLLIEDINLFAPLARASPSSLSPLGVRLQSFAPVRSMEAFQRGQFVMQDEGSQILALFALWPSRVARALPQTPGLKRGFGQGFPVPKQRQNKGRFDPMQSKAAQAAVAAAAEAGLPEPDASLLGQLNLLSLTSDHLPRPSIVIDACAGAGGKSERSPLLDI
jgi:hypothetical protein